MIDFDKFEKAEFTERTKEIPVPQLKAFFPEGEESVWKLRCVTASEMFYAREQAASSQRQKADLIDGLFANSLPDELISEIKEKVGLGTEADAVHRDVVLRRHLLINGSIPKCPENLAVKLSNNYGEVFHNLTNWLLVLYGEGNMPGELKDSGKTKKSK